MNLANILVRYNALLDSLPGSNTKKSKVVSHLQSNHNRPASLCTPIASASAKTSYHFKNEKSTKMKRTNTQVFTLSDDDEVEETTVGAQLAKDIGSHVKPTGAHFSFILMRKFDTLVSKTGTIEISKSGITIVKQNGYTEQISIKQVSYASGGRPLIKLSTLKKPDTDDSFVIILISFKAEVVFVTYTMLLEQRYGYEDIKNILGSSFSIDVVDDRWKDGMMLQWIKDIDSRKLSLSYADRPRPTRNSGGIGVGGFYGNSLSDPPSIRKQYENKAFSETNIRKSTRLNKSVVTYHEDLTLDKKIYHPSIPFPKTNNEYSLFYRLCHYPPNSRFSVSIKEHDAHRLNEGEFLNDTLLEFYLR